MNRRLLALLPILLLCLAMPAMAQIDKATIEAIAADQSQSPLPGVTVTVTRPATGYETMAVTDSSGVAIFVALQPGEYQVRWSVVSVDTHPTDGKFSFEVERR